MAEVESVTDVLKFKVEYDTKGAIRGLQAIDREFMRSAKDIGKALKSMDKATMSGVEGARRGWQAWREEVAASKQALRIVDAELKNLNRTYRQAQQTAKAGSSEEQTRARQEMKAIQSRVKGLQKVRDETEKLGKKTVRIKFVAFAKDIKRAFEGTNVFSRLLQKDIAGAFEAGGKLMGTIIEGSFRGLSGATGGGVTRAVRKFAGRQALAGKRRGGVAGGIQFAGAKAMVGISKAMGKFSKVAGVLSKIGPIVASLATALVGVVKLMLDAESAAKDFNRQILQSAATGRYLTDNFNDAVIASEELSSTMREIRDGAMALENLDMGISKEEHIAFTNILTQEGVELGQLRQQFEQYKKGAGAATQTVMSFQQATLTAVAYSRVFGVSLNEIGSFQAELMNEMGMSAGEVAVQFEQMKMAAGESGIAFNKFFAMVRGVSSDMALWNVRMEDAVKLLGKLGKVMSPRTAQQFLNTAMQGLKGMGRLERLRLTLLAGPGKVQQTVKRDIERKTKNMAKIIAEKSGVGEAGVAGIEAAIRDKKVSTSEILKNVPEDMRGELTEAIIRTRTQESISKKGGAFATAIAARTVGPGASLQIMQDALSRFAGGAKTLMEARGSIGAEMMAENLGISEEQLDQMVLFEQVMEDFRRQQLDKTTDPAEQERIQKMAYDELFDLMEPDQKKIIEDMGDTRTAAEKQGQMMQDLLTKLQVLIDFVMNQIYNVMLDIYEAVATINPLSDKNEAAIRKKIYQSKDMDLINAMKAGGDMAGLGGALGGGAMGTRLTSMLDERSRIKAEIAKRTEGMSDEERKKFYASDPLAARQKELDRATSALMPADASTVERMAEAAGIDPEKRKKLAVALEGEPETTTKMVGGHAVVSRTPGAKPSVGSALSMAGFSEEEIQRMLEKRFWAGGSDVGEAALAVSRVTSPLGQTEEAVAPAGKGEVPAGGPKSPAPVAPNTTERRARAAAAGGGAATVPPASPITPVAPTGSSRKSPAEDMLNGIHIQAMAAVVKLAEIHKEIKRGVKLDKSQLDNDVRKVVEEANLNAARVALLEYFLYSALASDDPAGIIERLRSGADPKTFGKEMMDVVSRKGEEGLMSFLGNPKKADKNAIGGTAMFVGPTGVAHMARTPTGEGWAPIGPGERITPAGRGGSNVNVNVAVSGGGPDIYGPDFQRYLRDHVTKWIQDHEYRRTTH